MKRFIIWAIGFFFVVVAVATATNVGITLWFAFKRPCAVLVSYDDETSEVIQTPGDWLHDDWPSLTQALDSCKAKRCKEIKTAGCSLLLKPSQRAG
jgi:hypothetical protein